MHKQKYFKNLQNLNHSSGCILSVSGLFWYNRKPNYCAGSIITVIRKVSLAYDLVLHHVYCGWDVVLHNVCLKLIFKISLLCTIFDHETNSLNLPCTAFVLVSFPSCPISVCPLRSVWLHAVCCSLNCESGHFSSPDHIFPTTAFAPLKSRFFVFSIRDRKGGEE